MGTHSMFLWRNKKKHQYFSTEKFTLSRAMVYTVEYKMPQPEFEQNPFNNWQIHYPEINGWQDSISCDTKLRLHVNRQTDRQIERQTKGQTDRSCLWLLLLYHHGGMHFVETVQDFFSISACHSINIWILSSSRMYLDRNRELKQQIWMM